jgi:hypothetical protein
MLYTTLSALVILSIFLGVILMAMEESAEEMDMWKRTNQKIHKVVSAKPFLAEYINVLMTVFETMDTSADGGLQIDEIKETLADICTDGSFNLQHAVQTFTGMDTDGYVWCS